MTLKIDETDFHFVVQILCRAKVNFESLMTDPNLCQTVRNRHRENAKMAQTARDLMYGAKEKGSRTCEPDAGAQVETVSRPPHEYVRTLEKALKPVLAVEGAIEQAKHTDRKINCREDERLFQSLDAVAKAQEIMQPVIAIEQAAAEVQKIMEAKAWPSSQRRKL